MNDSEILQLIAAGNERGLMELERRYLEHCAETALEVLNTAESDAAHTGADNIAAVREAGRQCAFDAFLKLWNCRGDIDPKTFPLREYLESTSRQMALSRKSRNVSTSAATSNVAATLTPAERAATPLAPPEQAATPAASDASSESAVSDASAASVAANKKRRTVLIAAGAVVLGLLIAALIIGAVINARSDFHGVGPGPSAALDPSAAANTSAAAISTFEPTYDPTAEPTVIPTEQIPETFLPADGTSQTPAVEKILSADLNSDRYAETIIVERSRSVFDTFTVSVREGAEGTSGKVIWGIGADLSHAGWIGCSLCHIGDRYGILVYRPAVYQGEATYSFTVYGFSKEFGAYVEDEGAVSFSMTGKVPLPVKAMVSFADRVNSYLAADTLLLSTLNGQLSTEGSLPPEQYSWTAAYAPDSEASMSRSMEDRLNEVRSILFSNYNPAIIYD